MVSLHVPIHPLKQIDMRWGGKDLFTQPIFIESNKKDQPLPSKFISRTPKNMLALYKVNVTKFWFNKMTDFFFKLGYSQLHFWNLPFLLPEFLMERSRRGSGSGRSERRSKFCHKQGVLVTSSGLSPSFLICKTKLSFLGLSWGWNAGPHTRGHPAAIPASLSALWRWGWVKGPHLRGQSQAGWEGRAAAASPQAPGLEVRRGSPADTPASPSQQQQRRQGFCWQGLLP